MSKVYVGKIVSFHGIKGEIRILSDFDFPDKAFLVGSNLIIDDKNYEIVSYRVHKNYHMVKFSGYDDINDVLFLKNKKVYKEKDDIVLEDGEILDEDLITFKVLTNEGKSGKIKEIFYASKVNKILRVLIDDREILIPRYSPFVKRIDKDKKIIEIEIIEGM